MLFKPPGILQVLRNPSVLRGWCIVNLPRACRHHTLNPRWVQVDPDARDLASQRSPHTSHFAHDVSKPPLSKAMSTKPLPSHAADPDMVKGKKKVSIPRPSASVVVVSPTNQVLLLHRVQTSSAFPSAHVFPGGNVSRFHDVREPEPTHPGRHEDSELYRHAAIRETFEESGILLARNHGSAGLMSVPEAEREEGRKKIHANEIAFPKWLASKGGRADISTDDGSLLDYAMLTARPDGLIPFTRWITPANAAKRYTTQMYLYFLPLDSGPPTGSSGSEIGPPPTTGDAVIATPKHDGGIEHTSARFLPPSKWLDLARSGEIILFPPQFFLLHQVARFLEPAPETRPLSPEALEQQRRRLRDYVARPAGPDDPPWGEVAISPIALVMESKDGRVVLALDKPGPELEHCGRRGTTEWVVAVRFNRDGPREVDVLTRKEVFARERVRDGSIDDGREVRVGEEKGKI